MKPVEGERMVEVGLSREDALCRSECIVGVNWIASVFRRQSPMLLGLLPDLKYWPFSVSCCITYIVM